MATEADRELAHEMSLPVFTNHDPNRGQWVIVRKDYDEGSSAMWREWHRFGTQDEARNWLRRKRQAEDIYQDETGYEPCFSYKIVEDK